MASPMDCRHGGGGKALFYARDYISSGKFAVRECSHCHLVHTDLSSTEQAVISETFYPEDYYGRQKRYPLFLGKILELDFSVGNRRFAAVHDPVGVKVVPNASLN